MPSSGPNGFGSFSSVSPTLTAPYINAWSNPSNASGSDNSYAIALTTGNGSASTGTYELRCQNPGFAISGTISGIEVAVECKAGAADLIFAPVMQLLNGNAGTDSDWIGDPKQASFTTVGSSDSTFTYGDPADLWGATLTDTIVNGSDFGVAVSFDGAPDSTHSTTAYVDRVTITVHYEGEGGGGTTYTLECASGSFSLTSEAVAITAGLTLADAAGTFTLSGGDLVDSDTLECVGATFTIAESTASLRTAATLACDGATYSLTGGNLSFALATTTGGTFWEDNSPSDGIWSDVSPNDGIWSDVNPNSASWTDT